MVGKKNHESYRDITIIPNDDNTGGGNGGGEGETSRAYREGTIYKGGDILSNASVVFECKPFPFSGWCGQGKAHYESGCGLAWKDVWIQK